MIMKRKITFVSVMLMMFISVACSAGTDVPATIRNFIAANFKSATIVKVERDSKSMGVEYDVTLSYGAKVDFDVNQKWESIDCEKASINVPQNIISKGIRAYLSKNYPKQKVVEIDRERYGYDVKLDNLLKLEFNSQGEFLRFD